MKKIILATFVAMIFVVSIIVLTGCFDEVVQPQIIEISAIESLIVDDVQVDLPQIIVKFDNDECIVAHYDLFWFNADHVYVWSGRLFVKPSAPYVFEDLLHISLRSNGNISATIKLHRLYVEVKSLTIESTILLVGEETQLTALFTPHNSTNRSLVWEVLQGDASISDIGIITPLSQSSKVATIRVTAANGVYSIIQLPIGVRIPISNALELSNIRFNPMGHFGLIGDIVLDGYWTPIANFRGTLEGNNHTISNLNLHLSTTAYTTEQRRGLFSTLYGTVRNLTISNPNIYTQSQHGGTWVQVGALAGIVRDGTISNVTISGGNLTVRRQLARVGGIVGLANNSTIEHSHVNGITLGGNGDRGGAVGYLMNNSRIYRTTVYNSTVNMWVSTRNSSAGGIVGVSVNSTIERCIIHNVTVNFTGSSFGGNTLEPAMGLIVGLLDGGSMLHVGRTGTNSFGTSGLIVYIYGWFNQHSHNQAHRVGQGPWGSFGRRTNNATVV